MCYYRSEEGEIMIELKYDEEKNNLRLPKNIHQVGKPGEKIKIYVEDYVITYINQIARESTDQQRLAVLLGKIGKNKEDTVAFIDGAVEARGVVVQEDQATFTSEIWTRIYDEIGQYFHNTEVVGWFLTRPGKAMGINDKITKIHVDNFPGADKSLFIVDPLDHDEAFYIYSQGELVRQDGYYIYFERNEDMQNYMVDHKAGDSSEKPENSIFLKKKEEILERRQGQKKEGHKPALFSKIGVSSLKKAEEKAEKTAEKAVSKSDIKVVKPSVNNTSDNEKENVDQDKGLSADLFKGMKRASSLVVTFAILFALIFGFNQLNRRQTQEVSSGSGNELVPVDVADGDLEAGDELAAADGLGESTGSELRDDAIATGNNDVTAGDEAAVADGSDNTGNADGAVVADGTEGTGNSDNAAVDGGTDTLTDPDGTAVADGFADTDPDSTADSEAAVSDAGSDGTEVPVQNVIRQYEVREGDTLAGISEKFFNNYKYIEVIQEMNQIEDPDMIFPGMMLNLPTQ